MSSVALTELLAFASVEQSTGRMVFFEFGAAVEEALQLFGRR